ncbi:hsp70 nucleotide exchange factor fes1 [Trapelia coarctata]|nr:hsp70 nucleotide exchange factor fes1 [Trapelia coarctata]
MDRNMSTLLKWGIENSAPTSTSTSTTSADPSATSSTDPSTTPTLSSPTAYSTSNPPPSSILTPSPSRSLDPALVQALFGGPSDADLMKESMASILSPTISLDNKLAAFDNFEQLIEQIDNANNLAPLQLWTPLLSLLKDEEGELRRMAAWCVGTAVQNNAQAQERALVVGAVPVLVKMCVEERDEGVRRKAMYALSSLMRNFQPGADEVVRVLPEGLQVEGKVDAGDMEAVSGVIQRLRERA